MKATNSDPAMVAAEKLMIAAPKVPGYSDEEKSPLDKRRDEHVAMLADAIREAYEPYIQAAEEMARCLSLLERDHYSEPFPSLARWKELIGEE